MSWVNAIIQGILLGGLYALFAAGLSLMFGVMRIVNLAHGDMAILAAFLAYSLSTALGINPFITLAIIIPAMFAMGFLLQYGVFNRSLRSGEFGPLLATFGVSIIIQNSLEKLYSSNQRGLNAGPIETSGLHLGSSISIGWLPLLTLVLAVLVITGLELLLRRTQLGRAFRAVADDPEAARTVGLDQRKLYAVATGIALATVGVAGVLLGIRSSFGPTDGPTQLLFAFEAVIIGGLGSLRGTLVGGIVLGVAQTVTARIDPTWSIIVGHLVFLTILVVRPSGLLSTATSRTAGA
jgi:branched-chain amino acid transport system permease protein